jgi:hypothetical protein
MWAPDSFFFAESRLTRHPLRRFRMALVLAVLIMLLAAWQLGLFERIASPTELKRTLVNVGPWGYAAFIAAYALFQPFGLPGSIFVWTAPLIWPWPIAFALSMTGSLAASIVGFSFARFVARDWVTKKIPGRFGRYNDALAQRAFATVFLLRTLFWGDPRHLVPAGPHPGVDCARPHPAAHRLWHLAPDEAHGPLGHTNSRPFGPWPGPTPYDSKAPNNPPRSPSMKVIFNISAMALAAFLIACVPVADSPESDAGATTGDGGDHLQWYLTCGDPSCSGHSDDLGVDACTDEVGGEACTSSGTTCDPIDDCNALLICADQDPRTQSGGCPISQRGLKRNIQYIDKVTRQRLARELLDVRLATYLYKGERDGVPARLGFIIDDMPGSRAVRPDAERGDLYGYTSMAVAAIQAQELRIKTLEQELANLKSEMAKIKAQPRP